VHQTSTKTSSSAQADRRKRANASGWLRQANTRVEMILDSITDRFFGLDRQWRFTYFNKQAEEC